MSLKLVFKNELGEVLMHGSGSGAVRVLGVEGLGPLVNEYTSAIYSGNDGQETLAHRAMPRTITVSAEVSGMGEKETLKSVVRVLSKPGVLFVMTEDFSRRIECNQVQMTDIKRVIKGKIATFVVQFVCDSPYFMDEEDKTVALYERQKLLQSPFSLPTKFGEIVLGAKIEIKGEKVVEPRIEVYYPSGLDEVENITIRNETIGKSIKLDYAPCFGGVVTIDVRNRKITGGDGENIINHLSMDTFLGDFVLVPGVNVLSVDMGDVASGFTISCTYSDLYGEAVIV